MLIINIFIKSKISCYSPSGLLGMVFYVGGFATAGGMHGFDSMARSLVPLLLRPAETIFYGYCQVVLESKFMRKSKQEGCS